MAWVIGIGMLVAGYLLGSLPTGYLVTRAIKGVDIREHGSGNTGATNVMRVVGKTAGFTVLAIDIVKGFLAVSLTQIVLSMSYAELSQFFAAIPWWMTGAGLLALIGHSRSIWLNWTGGKSAATGLGVLLALYWPAAAGAATIFGVTLAATRIVSLSSIITAIAAAVLMVTLQQPLPFILLAVAGSLYVVLRHRSNIQRLMAGTEPRLGSGTSGS